MVQRVRRARQRGQDALSVSARSVVSSRYSACSGQCPSNATRQSGMRTLAARDEREYVALAVTAFTLDLDEVDRAELVQQQAVSVRVA